jgi:DNA polymerase-3 subunit epsilon
MAFLLECIEIKRLWPLYNRSLKRFEQIYGLYVFEDRSGYSRLVLEKRKKQLQPVYTFSLLMEGQNLLWKLIREWKLCPKLCFIQTNDGPCEGIKEQFCQGACEHKEPASEYNRRVALAVESLVKSLPSFTLVDDGRHPEEKSCILVEKGKFYGMGYLPAGSADTGSDSALYDTGAVKAYLTAYPENDYMRGLVYQYVQRWPAKRIDLLR